jgi:uncharacterized protein (DUF736 family)
MSDNANKPKSDQIEVGALWKKEGKSQKFLAGNLDLNTFPEPLWAEFIKTKKLPLVIFTNKFKQKETHPDLRVYLSKPKESPPAETPSQTEPVATQAASDNEII